MSHRWERGLLLRHKLFGVYMAFLVLGVIVNDVSAYLGPSSSSYVAAAHQTSILLIFFAAFLAGTAAMYDITSERSSLGLGRGAFIYASIVWCVVNSFWAVGFYLLQAAVDSASLLSSFGGYDAPFSFGFYTPIVPRIVMIAYGFMNLLAVYLIWKRKSVSFALGGIFLPVLFVNVYAFFLGKVMFASLSMRPFMARTPKRVSGLRRGTFGDAPKCQSDGRHPQRPARGGPMTAARELLGDVPLGSPHPPPSDDPASGCSGPSAP